MQTDNTKSLEYNLGVLKKHDRNIVRVLHTAGHAVVYMYKDDEGAESPWERHNVEGALFIVERSSEPRYQLWILNRLSTNNLVEDITSDFSIEATEEFLLYKNNEGEVLGLWFYNAADRDSVARLIEGLVEQAALQEQGVGSAPPPIAPLAGSNASVDAFFAAARIATSPVISAAPAPQQLSADAIGLLSKLQSAAQPPQPSPPPPLSQPPAAQPKQPPKPPHPKPPPQSAPAAPAAGGHGAPPAALDPTVRAAIRQALARVVQEERFLNMVEEEYAKIALAAPAPPRAQPAPPRAEPVDPKDGNALLKNLLSGLK